MRFTFQYASGSTDSVQLSTCAWHSVSKLIINTQLIHLSELTLIFLD